MGGSVFFFEITFLQKKEVAFVWLDGDVIHQGSANRVPGTRNRSGISYLPGSPRVYRLTSCSFDIVADVRGYPFTGLIIRL